MPNDFERRYFNALDENFKDIKDDIKEVKDETKQTLKHVEKINGRLSRVEAKVFPAGQATPLVPLYRDPQILRLLSIIAAGIVLMLIIFAGLKGISIPKGLL